MADRVSDSSERRPDISEVIRRSIDGRLSSVHTAIPAVICSWNADKQRASCKVLVKQPYFDEEGIRQVESIAVIPGVPVQFMGAGGFRMTCPISDGNLVIEGNKIKATTGTLFFTERSLDRWLSGIGAEVDPDIDHMFDMTDAIFIAGLNPFGAPLSSCPTDHMTLGADAGVQIHFHNGTIACGDESGNDFVALAQKVLDNFNALKDHFSAIEGVLTGPPINEPGNGAPSALQAALALSISAPPNSYPAPTSVAASQIKAK